MKKFMSDIGIEELKHSLQEKLKTLETSEAKIIALEKTIHKLTRENEELQKRCLQKEAELKDVFENVNDAFVSIDLKGNVFKMNDIASDIFGYKYDEKNSLNLMKLVHPDDFEYTQKVFGKLVEEGSYSKYRSRIITKSGIVKKIEVNSSLLFDSNKKIIGAQGIVRDITQEIAVQKLLEAQKNQLDIIFNNSPIGITLSEEKENDFVFVNNSLTTMLGYSLAELKKLKVTDFTHPEDRKKSNELKEKLYNGEIDKFSLEKRYIQKSGNVLWAKTTVKAIRDEKSNIKFQVATVEDITENKLSKEKLIESENRLTSLISKLYSGVLLENEKREIVISNEKFCDLFSINIPPSSLKEKDSTKLFEESKMIFENPDYYILRIKKLIKDKKVVLGDELRLTDGRILERDYVPISKDKEYKGHLWTYRDVTLSRNYRKSLEAHKKRYSNIIANLQLGLVELDNRNFILSANKSFVKMTGFEEDQIIEKDIRNLFKKDKIKEFIQKRSINRKNRRSGSYEFKFINNLNEEKSLLVSTAPNFNIRGEVIGSIGIILDITHIKSLESQKEVLLKKLEQRNVELEEYAHVVSHDLKSPLRSISALTSWLKEDYGDSLGDGGLKNVDLIQEVVEKMERLINDILNYSSINNDSDTTEEVNTYEVITGIKNLIYTPKHVKIKINKNLPIIKANKVRIQQLFQNLMSNAVNYIDKKEGLVTVNFKEKKKGYVFSIKDNGIGIPEEYHAKIFEVFQSLGTHKDSTGIGLSIVKKIVDMYNGKIWLESEKGKGTTFFIEFKK